LRPTFKWSPAGTPNNPEKSGGRTGKTITQANLPKTQYVEPITRFLFGRLIGGEAYDPDGAAGRNDKLADGDQDIKVGCPVKGASIRKIRIKNRNHKLKG
jgi:hypothetical protein